MAERTVRIRIYTAEGEGVQFVDPASGDQVSGHIETAGFVRATVRAVPQSNASSTAVVEVKKAWTVYDSGISFATAQTLDLDGAAALEDIDCTRAPYLRLHVTTFEASDSVEVVVHLTDAADPFPVVKGFAVENSLDRIPGYSDVHKFGANDVSPSTTERDIWEYGSTALGDTDYTWPIVATVVRAAAGGNVADVDTTGAGARTVTITGLDENWNEVSETISLAGASASGSTTTTFFRVFRAFVATAGTYRGNNTGAVAIESPVTSNVLAYIGAGVGQTQMALYTVPAGKTAVLTSAKVSVAVGTNKDATVRMYQYPGADDFSAPTSGGKRLVYKWQQIQGEGAVQFGSHPTFPEKTDLWWTCRGSAATAISLTFDLVLADT